MIEISNVYKYFENLKVLDNISLKVNKGEIITIVGESGAGKSTLLQIMGTLDKPSFIKENKTKITIGGESILDLKDKELSIFRNKNIGFIFQFHQLLPEFTAIENVMIPGMIAKGNYLTLKKRASELLNFLKLSHRLNHKPSELSGGEQQRVAVARALFNNPSIILADEPSGNLDSKNAEDLHRLFFDLRENFSQTFIIVTHNNELAEMADRKLIMKDGKIIE